MSALKILLVDDEEKFVSALAQRLALRGFVAEWAVSGAEALAKASRTTFDLAILDVKMPRLGGVDLKRELSRIMPGTRFIFFTGHGSEDEFKVCSAEASCYLVKPMPIDELVVNIHRVMGISPKEN
ncbi:response regulator [Pseudodesulfovibrio alkaliphilus]|uniref:response regulator n=1 Tax=Pseudodesulfovibrio alkaliphilus TaxID=2661613 RepID=UPI003462F463